MKPPSPRRTGAIAACIVLLACGLSSAPAFAADEWQTLFNGKDLTGWCANAVAGGKPGSRRIM